jgi:hypothetical protein
MAFGNPVSSPGAGPRRGRPGVVTAAVVALLAQPAAGLGIGTLAVASLSQVATRYAEITGPHADLAASEDYVFTVRVFCIGFLAYSIIAATTTALLAVGLLRRSRAARVLIWIGGGIFALGSCCGGSALFLAREWRHGMAHDGVPPPSVADLIGSGAWWGILSMTVLQLVLLVAAALLLATRPAAEFFTRPDAAPVGPR